MEFIYPGEIPKVCMFCSNTRIIEGNRTCKGKSKDSNDSCDDFDYREYYKSMMSITEDCIVNDPELVHWEEEYE
jgi:hypothetical protein